MPTKKEIDETFSESQKLNVFQRMNAVMKEVDYVQKTKNPGMQYSTVSHDAVTALVRPSIVKWGLVYYPVAMTRSQEGNRTEVELTVRIQNVDDREDYIDVPTIGYGIDSQDKGPGKAVSYAVKYALLKAFGLETGDDPDNDQKSEYKPSEKPQATQYDDEKLQDGEYEIVITDSKQGITNGKAWEVLKTDHGRLFNNTGKDLPMNQKLPVRVERGGVVGLLNESQEIPFEDMEGYDV